LIAVFSGMFEPKQAVYATSLLTVSGSIGRMIATGTNGLFNSIGGYSLTFLLAACAAGAAIMLVLVTPLERNRARGVTFKSIRELFTRADVMLPSIISLVGQIGNWAVTFGFLPILAEELGAGDVAKGLLVSLNLAALTAGNMLNTVIVRKVRYIPVISVSIVVFAIGIALTTVASSLAALFAAAMLMGLTNGFSYPTLMGLSIHRVDQSHRSSAMGIHQSVYAIGMFSGPWLGGLLADAAGIRPMFLITAAFIVVASLVLIAFYARWIRRLTPPSADGA
jgi:MFS family permease